MADTGKSRRSKPAFDATTPLSPLADPVVGAIFCDAEHAGLAMGSLAGAVTAKDGLTIGKILSVTPRSYIKQPNLRGVRLDIEGKDDQNNDIIMEVQLNTDIYMLYRNVFAAAHAMVDRVPEGTKSDDLVKMMPKIIVIDLLNYNLREDNKDYLQPIKMLYTKPPMRGALSQISIYVVQLPRIREIKRNFKDGLFCWLYTLDTAHQEKKTIQEVLDMEPKLKPFAEKDAGFKQYRERYDRVTSSRKVRDEYFRWIDEQLHEAGLFQGGKLEGKLEAAKNFLAMGLSTEQVVKGTGLPLADVKALL
ncbi:MAG: Rpn family recombination-promoting nuclease/putative transposase [Spirochaetaceae bacterium]|jgi:predicted transposase/invertase (TIGR01784 family)|nr:Rpn family recombination-promoting nuclease/putative transposase [Spirochaetaceae bacterium]